MNGSMKEPNISIFGSFMEPFKYYFQYCLIKTATVTDLTLNNLSAHFNSCFPGGPTLAGTRMSPFWILLELRMLEVVVTTGASGHLACEKSFQLSIKVLL